MFEIIQSAKLKSISLLNNLEKKQLQYINEPEEIFNNDNNFNNSIIDDLQVINDTIQSATFFVFETFVRVKQMNGFVKWIEILKRLYSNNIPMCKWFLDLLCNERKSWFRYLLIECYEDYIRTNFQELLFVLLKTLGPSEYVFYLETEKKTGGAGLFP